MFNVIFANLVTLQVAPARSQAPVAVDPLQLVMNASPTVMLVMIILLIMSLVSWFVIGAKLVRLAQAGRDTERFLDRFWDPELGNIWDVERIENLYEMLKLVRRSPVANLYHAGYVELARVLQAGGERERGAARIQSAAATDNVARALRRATISEVTSLQTMIPFLATTGSTAPFVGLFGTVWGIMNAFINIGSKHNASLDVVAPGIAEALIATAIGLAAAIPAVMAYNFFVRRISVLEGEMENFSNDFLNIVRRHFLTD